MVFTAEDFASITMIYSNKNDEVNLKNILKLYFYYQYFEWYYGKVEESVITQIKKYINLVKKKLSIGCMIDFVYSNPSNYINIRQEVQDTTGRFIEVHSFADFIHDMG